MTTGFIAPVPTTHSLTLSSSTALVCSSFVSSTIQPSFAPLTRVRPEGLCDHAATITMKKGRLQRPVPQRPQQQQQMKLPEDGTPVFALFVRTPRQKIWYPLGAVKGDDRSKNLVNALKGGFASGMYQKALDRGMAQTLYGKDNNRYLDGAFRLYPQLKKFAKELEFGYRIAALNLEDQKTRVVSKDLALPFFASVKKQVSDFLGGKKDK